MRLVVAFGLTPCGLDIVPIHLYILVCIFQLQVYGEESYP